MSSTERQSDPQSFKLPEKLKKDSIIEAICEVRFVCDELEELVIGRLIDKTPWKEHNRTRLPIADIPSPIRQADQNLKYQPVFELKNKSKPQIVKIGGNVISFHVLSPYCGWNEFKPLLDEVIETLMTNIDNVSITRIGLRYINALTEDDHHIKNVADLKLKISVGRNNSFPHSLNLNFMQKESDYSAVIRIASPEFITGTNIPSLAALVDVDISTSDSFNTLDSSIAKIWIEKAHLIEKNEYFNLIPDNIIDLLKEE